MSLQSIQATAQQAAEAITASLELETEIVDENLRIIGGTGRYREKIGEYEEDGDLQADRTYAICLRTGTEYTNFDPGRDATYDAREHELGEICCPITLGNHVLGLIGLIAFTPVQRSLLMDKVTELTRFLRSMAKLIAGTYAAEMNNIRLQNTLASLLPGEPEASFDTIIGQSNTIRQLKERGLQVAGSDSTILLTGESGTGKDLFARAIHNASGRSEESFVNVNCAALPEMLLESELFGYEGGAFTGANSKGKLGKFQLADGGTLFLDEIGDLPLHLQAKLLTALQNRQIDPIGATTPVGVDVRLIAATNKNLEELITKKQFREDLYFRLNVIPLTLPPLRERREDIALLLDYFLEKFADKLKKPIYFIHDKAKERLLRYPWPGNVRELENVMEYAVNMATDNTIVLRCLPDRLQDASVLTTDGRNPSLKGQLALRERDLIVTCLDEHGWSLEGKRLAAQALGISESTLYRRLRSFDLL